MIKIKDEDIFVDNSKTLIICSREFKQQILKDHEDAGYWHKWVGNQSLQEILDVWKKDRQIVKRLEERIKKIKDDYSNKNLPSVNMDKIEVKVDIYMMQELEKILEGKK